MEYKRVIVDKLPEDCRSCHRFLLGYKGSQCDFVGDIVPMFGRRPSNCILELETDHRLAECLENIKNLEYRLDKANSALQGFRNILDGV